MDSNFRFRAKNGRLGYQFRSCAALDWAGQTGHFSGQQAAYRSNKGPPMSERGQLWTPCAKRAWRMDL